MNERFYSNSPFISINISILLTVTLIYISMYIEKIKIVNSFLAYLGINSLTIMIFMR